jgi:putative component of toxin-antitoxin plasmid stabilization module
VAAERITIALTRLGQGNVSNVQGVGSGAYEVKIDFGPGYRVYFGKDGEHRVLAGREFEETAEHGDCGSPGSMGRVQAPQRRQGVG